ncbi:hypothetical protein OC846_005091 [Tilletia horrida]|uniref:Uncharacterized protein n=1 Tax=Tilletia horrida TaxID=155126 RepID=A0AAN6JWC1_9BASI|nr:hypothetical protein OC846_005091 [Tilletia horrida]
MSLRSRASGSRNPYARLAGAAAALTTVVGLGVYAYVKWNLDTQPGQGGDDWAAGGGSRDATNQQRQSLPKTKKPAQPGPRPTLSLSLPTTFDRNSTEALQRLHDLIDSLAHHFLIHLLIPTALASDSEQDGQYDGTGALAAIFADVLDFDARRILLYSTSAGRQALSVALACDAHVEVIFADTVSLAASGQVEEYTKSIEHLQRAAGVVVLLVLPGSERSAAAPGLEAILIHFKKASFSKSVRIIDERRAAGPEAVIAAWRDGADRIVELRSKMKR